jgi:hypothetical protein
MADINNVAMGAMVPESHRHRLQMSVKVMEQTPGRLMGNY